MEKSLDYKNLLKYFMLLMLKYVYTYIKDFSKMMKFFSFLAYLLLRVVTLVVKDDLKFANEILRPLKSHLQSCVTPEIIFKNFEKCIIKFIEILSVSQGIKNTIP